MVSSLIKEITGQSHQKCRDDIIVQADQTGDLVNRNKVPIFGMSRVRYMPKYFLQNINISLFQTKNKNCSFIRTRLFAFKVFFHLRNLLPGQFSVCIPLIFKTVTCAKKVPTLSFIFSKLRSNWFEIFLFEMQLVSCCDPYQPQQGAHGQAEHHWTKLYLYLFQPFFLFRWVQIVLNQPWESAKISKYYWPKAEARSALFNKTWPLDYLWVNVSVNYFWR